MNWPELFLYLLCAFVIGTALGALLPSNILKLLSSIAELFFLFLGSVALLFAVFLGGRQMLLLGLCAAFCLCGAFFGFTRFVSADNALLRPELEKLYGQELVLETVVNSEPTILDYKQRVELRIVEFDAVALVTTSLYPELKYGDRVRVKGELKEPYQGDEFNYKDYLSHKGIYFTMSYPDISVISHARGFSPKVALFAFKGRIKDSIERIYPFPEAGFFQALIFGDEENIPLVWKERLNVTGTRHIAAVSGMNITIMGGILLNALLGIGFWRKHALYIYLIIIALYVLMIGAPACAVRAGVMAGFLVLATQAGRIADSKRIVVFTLALMLVFDPLVLLDIGFQLSFLAFIGLLYLTPLFSKHLKRVPQAFGLRQNLASTLGAQMLVLPLLLYNFGRLSLISPLANILVLPSLAFLTISGFLAGLAGIVTKPLGILIALPSQIIMEFNLWITRFFANLPFASHEISISKSTLFLAYSLFLIIPFLHKKYLQPTL